MPICVQLLQSMPTTTPHPMPAWLILLAMAVAMCVANSQQHQIANYLSEGDPIKVMMQISNSTHKIHEQSFQLLYSLNQPPLTAAVSVPVHALMDNLTLLTTLWSETSPARPLSQSLQNLTRYAKIKTKHEETHALSMQFPGVEGKHDENTAYGLHIAIRFSLLVLYADYPVPLNRDYFNMFNINMAPGDHQQGRRYVLPVDISQMQVPYKTYKHVPDIQNDSHQILFTVKPFSFTSYQFFYGLTNREYLQRANPMLGDIYTEATIDTIKEVFFNNNFYLVVAYFLLCFIQTFMQIFAFKNEIEIWKSVEMRPGLSIKTLYQRLVCQLIICLYLYEKESNILFLGFQVFDLLLTCWKITRALSISLSTHNKYLLSVSYKEWYHSKVEEVDSNALHYTNYLLMGLLVPFMLYKVYPIASKAHESYSALGHVRVPAVREVYMFLLESSVIYIFVFGFVMMTPQLYINYRLKSVDHLPWKTLFYRFIVTIIDDIFVLMIELPWLQRMFSFRDDVIFVLYLVQRKLYRVDPKRLATSQGTVQLNAPAPPHLKAQ